MLPFRSKRLVYGLVASSATVVGALLLWPTPHERVAAVEDRPAAEVQVAAAVAPRHEPALITTLPDRATSSADIRPVTRDAGSAETPSGEIRIVTRTSPPQADPGLAPSDPRPDETPRASPSPSPTVTDAPAVMPTDLDPAAQRAASQARKKPRQQKAAAAPQQACTQFVWPGDLPANWTTKCSARPRAPKS